MPVFAGDYQNWKDSKSHGPSDKLHQYSGGGGGDGSSRNRFNGRAQAEFGASACGGDFPSRGCPGYDRRDLRDNGGGGPGYGGGGGSSYGGISGPGYGDDDGVGGAGYGPRYGSGSGGPGYGGGGDLFYGSGGRPGYCGRPSYSGGSGGPGYCGRGDGAGYGGAPGFNGGGRGRCFGGGGGSGPAGGNYGRPAYEKGPPNSDLSGPGFGGIAPNSVRAPFGGAGAPDGPVRGGSYEGDFGGGHSAGWNDGPPRPYGEDTWRSQQINTWWAGDRPKQYDDANWNENARNCQKIYPAPFRPGEHPAERPFLKKSDMWKSKSSTSQYFKAQERSRYATSKDSISDNKPKERAKEVTADGSLKAESKKEEAINNAALNKRQNDETERVESERKETESENTQEMKITDPESEESPKKKSRLTEEGANDDPLEKDSVGQGKGIRIRSDLTHDDIHHFKPLAFDFADKKKEDTKGDLPSRDGSPPQRIRSPVLDPLKYVEELSNPDADPPQLHDLEKELLPKKILPAHKGNFEQKKPLIVDRSSSGQQSRTALSNSATSDNFGGFFAGPVIAGPSKMHVRKRPLVHSPPHAACYPEPDRPYKPGLLDGPKNNSTYEEQYYPPQESPRQFKPGVLNGPTTVPAKAAQERPRNGPAAADPAISAVAESLTAVATALASPEIIATVVQKGLADELFASADLKAKIKEVYAEEIQKMLAKKSEKHMTVEAEKRQTCGGQYRDERLRNDTPCIAESTGYARDSRPAEQMRNEEKSVLFFKYSDSEYRTGREDGSAKITGGPYGKDDSKYYSGPPYQEYGEEHHYKRRPATPCDAAPPTNYERDRYGPPQDHYSGRPQERYDDGRLSGNYSNSCGQYGGPPPDRYSSPPANYGSCSDPLTDRYGGPPDQHSGPRTNYSNSYGPAKNANESRPPPNFLNRSFDGPRNFGGPYQGRRY